MNIVIHLLIFCKYKRFSCKSFIYLMYGYAENDTCDIIIMTNYKKYESVPALIRSLRHSLYAQ